MSEIERDWLVPCLLAPGAAEADDFEVRLDEVTSWYFKELDVALAQVLVMALYASEPREVLELNRSLIMYGDEV